jgi:hypothetical protein
MKTRFALKFLRALAAGGLLAASAQFAAAQVTAAQTVPVQSSDGQTTTVTLSPGVPEILKLSAAHVGDDAIIAFIGNSGTSYNLGVNEIIYLKGQGLSDHVLAVMLDQHKHVAAVSVQVTTPAPAPAPAAPASTPTSVYANIPGTEFAPSVAQQSFYSQTAPASTVYVAQPSPTYDYSSSYPYYASYPYYGGYYGYGCSYPSLSLGIGIGLGGWCGGGWGGGCYRGYGWGSGCWGGYRGGYCGFGGGCGFRGGFCRR